MASGRRFSHTLFQGLGGGGEPGSLPSALTDPTLQSPVWDSVVPQLLQSPACLPSYHA